MSSGQPEYLVTQESVLWRFLCGLVMEQEGDLDFELQDPSYRILCVKPS